MLQLKYFAGCLLVFSLFLSCKKSDSFDVKGDPQVKFFTNNESPGNAPVNSINYNVVNYPNVAAAGLLNLSHTVPASIKFPVFASSPVSEDVEISAELDNSLVAKYNAANNTNYSAFPVGMLNTTGLKALLRKDSTRSVDSITIITDPAVFNALTEKAYMAPIKLTSVSKPAVGGITATATHITYVVFNVELRRIKYNATTADVQGALATPRTSWTVVFNPAPATFGGNGSIFDGSTSTYSRWANGTNPAQIDVNMQASRNVTGIRLYTSNTSGTTPTQIQVYLSNDGINWDHIGSPLRANLTYASAYNYILFYKAIPAQYIRLVLSYSTSTNTQNFRVTEFDVYAN